jgi:hypothetical protein
MPCPHGLGAVGTWENVTPPQIPLTPDNPIGQSNGSIGIVGVAVDPEDPAVVYTSGESKNGNGSNGIFKSTDCGATWVKIDTGRNAAALDSGSQWYGGIVIDPTNSQVMYAESGYGAGGLFKSTNGGVDWDQLFPQGSLVAQTVQYNATEDTAMDPNDPQHLVVTMHADCMGDYAPVCMAETKDGGNNWRLFKGPPPLTDWAEGAGTVVLGATSFLYSAPFNGVFYTGDGGATWKKVADSGSFQPYRAHDGTIYLGSNNGVIRSPDGQNWTVIPQSPRSTAIIGDGTNLYAAFTNDYSGKPMWTAPEANPATWMNVDTPTMTQGSAWLGYDPDHHILYAANMNAGLWRVVTGASSDTADASADAADATHD